MATALWSLFVLLLFRGFIAQTPNHVISTLWPVPGRASARCMRARNPARNSNDSNVSLASQQAQLVLIRSNHYTAPFCRAASLLTSINQALRSREDSRLRAAKLPAYTALHNARQCLQGVAFHSFSILPGSGPFG
jgi:hypothetical protein